jgi:hypothetical protein
MRNKTVWCLTVVIMMSLKAGHTHALPDAGTANLSISAYSDWVEGTEAADDGATRDYYNRAARLAWDNALGDWRDANDQLQGDNPYAVTGLIDDDTQEYISWEVTTLIEEWLAGTYPNKGFFLRGISGAGPFKFYSREHADPGQRPILEIHTSTGDYLIDPSADVYLDPSTYQGLGDVDRLEISTEKPTLLRFDLSAVPESAVITSASLRLFVYAEYGGGSMEVGVFRCSQGHDLPSETPVSGLSADYPLDDGIESDPAVYLFSNFESADWGDFWTFGTDAATLEVVISDPDSLFAPFQGKALRSEIPAGSNTGMNMGFDFADELGFEPDEIYFRYYLRFADDWETSDGGKLPGISGTYGVAGWGGRPSDGTNGWSARGTFHLVPPAGNPFEQSVPIGNYVYHADMTGQYGDIDLWQLGYRGILEKNRWYSVEQFLRMNTPGENDGVLRAWVDGRLAYERTDWRWRDIDSLKIERIWMNVYHGGTAAVPQDVHLYIDNVVIANRYIGPLAPASLVLSGFPADETLHLNWTVNTTIPVSTTWQLSYEGPPGNEPSPLTGIPQEDRTTSLTGLTNYAPYTITLNAMISGSPYLTDTLPLMPSNLVTQLPVMLKMSSP